ncbi:PRC and DUF2382 domain-containing protein [Streptomyces microflavus]|uniref:PRC and DUF2382 domain-containing protein n=1 Tax=Streptomyces microflavus TaxID=1919 RepID=A0A6N9VFT1_STRMI|nr:MULTISPECIES: PRC and DUF2382 domain-containing protein [Streptomyces]MBK5990249.1 PRC and DUF2382 domain-containing protein [Streptomyces sp. MBT58]NEB71720.1 PRC and DUF2382 domain-containing protein [Streptomyces microflavus]OXY87047.1 photosystem reaction center subunit H [Streptomyces sp. 2R]QKW41409.1 PRC and DUF2382 domain-containing protein [Streptomyces microflavus]QQZ52643.1 PRC and DUF2382 domain-containing protein [Streptomyces microflavus]
MGAADGFTDSGELDGLTVYDNEGEKVGSVGRVYVDDDTGKPDWVTVKTGMFGMKESFVPLAGARRVGSDLHVSHSKDTVKEAPRVDADAHLSVAEEEELYRHYGLTRKSGNLGDTGKGTGTGADARTVAGTGAMGAAGAGAGAAGAARGTGTPPNAKATGAAGMAGTGKHRDTDMSATSRPLAGAGAGTSRAADLSGKEEMIRSEEQLHVGTEEYESGRARLHKYVVTEEVTRSVPVSHEEVRVVREPLRPGEKVTGTTDFGEQDVEVTLHAERATVRKEAVPVERVRLETNKVTEQKEVSAEIRKEKIDYGDGKDMDTGKETGGEFGQGRRR